MLVDTQITPEATRRLVNDIKTLTDKPIKYVINTHWHYDHTHKPHYQNINGPGFQEATIARIYDVLDQRAK